MKIETLEIHNYKVLQNVKIDNIGSMAVFLGENGVGKTTLFDVFGFIKSCLTENVRSALQARGGYAEVHSRDAQGDIEIIFKYRISPDKPLCSYELHIGLNEKKNPVINRERLSYRRGSGGRPWNFIDFSMGRGGVITNEGALKENIEDAERETFDLAAPDILAIKSLGQKKKFRLPKNVSHTELRVIGCVGKGLANREIAEQLELREGTVRNYISSVLQKTGLRDRTQLAIFSIENGL